MPRPLWRCAIIVHMTNKSNRTGAYAGIPYDWRKPTKERLKARVWNATAPLFTPKWFGWGYDVNLYALIHPLLWRRARSSAKRR